MRGRLDRFLDRLLGERCERCRLRVFPRDLGPHRLTCD